MLTLRQKQTGDTIVEVLIAMAVIASMMAGAFVSTRRSSSGMRQSQERVEGLKVAEEQIERLKVLADKDAVPLKDASASNYFCIDFSGNRQESGGSLQPLDTDSFSSANYYINADPNKTCPRQPAGGVTYYPAIVRDLSTNTFKVYVRWARAGGGGNEQVTIVYRLHP